jgi:hypothetical protein
MTYGNYRKLLPTGHPLRTDPSLGPPEVEGPPQARTTAELAFFGAEVAKQRLLGIKQGNVGDLTSSTGILGDALLASLPDFDVVGGCNADPMHVLRGMSGFHLLTQFLCKRDNRSYDGPVFGKMQIFQAWGRQQGEPMEVVFCCTRCYRSSLQQHFRACWLRSKISPSLQTNWSDNQTIVILILDRPFYLS